MYADDTSLTIAADNLNNLETLMNADLQGVSEWLLAKKLSLNVTKTEYILLGSEPKIASIPKQAIFKIRNTPIKQVTSSKLLGVHIDETLSWSAHIDNIAKKVSMGIGAKKQIRSFVSFNTLLTVYIALILPHFDYCDVVWDNCKKGLSDRLQKLQNRAARVITRSNYDVRSSDILASLEWDNLTTRRVKHKACMMFKIMNDKAPSYLKTKYNLVRDTKSYNLRNGKHKLSLPKPNTDSMKRSFKFDGAKIWNCLPTSTKNSTSLQKFKKELELIDFKMLS